MDKLRLGYWEQKRKKERKKEIFEISIIVIIVMIILSIAISGKRIQLKIKKSSMDSKVEAYYVQVERKIEVTGEERHRITYSRNYKYRAIYLYEVNGEQYRYCTPYYNIKDISQIKNETTIYYDSNDPNNSVSEFELKGFRCF